MNIDTINMIDRRNRSEHTCDILECRVSGDVLYIRTDSGYSMYISYEIVEKAIHNKKQ